MRPLRELVQPRLVDELRARIAGGEFPGVDFETAMRFLLTDGVVPASGLPVVSFLRLEEWVRRSTSTS